MQLVLSRADARAQCVELPPRLIGIDERLVQLGRADAAVTRTARADTKAVRRLAELTQTVFATRLIVAQVGRDAVLAAGVAIATDAVARKAVDAVFVADCPPIGGQALLCTHGIAAGEDCRGGEDENAHTCLGLMVEMAKTLAAGRCPGRERLHSSQVIGVVALPFR